jgi:hypothetical protein
MQLYLSCHVLSVEVRVPPPPLVGIASGAHERDAEVTLRIVVQNRGLLGQPGRPRRRLHHGTRGALVLVHDGALAVLGLPGVVHLEATVELVAASLQQVDVARRVDGVAQLRIFPLGQVVLAFGHGRLLVSHRLRSKQRHIGGVPDFYLKTVLLRCLRSETASVILCQY